MKLIVVIDYLFKGHLRIKSDEDHYNCTEEQTFISKVQHIHIHVIYTLTFLAKFAFLHIQNVLDLPEYIKCVAIQLKIDSKILKY